MEALVAHPYADTVPPMTEEEYVNLRDDIRANGLIEPVVIFEGKILDGRHRYKACLAEGKPVHSVEFRGTNAEALSRVISLNLARRHLTVSQRACYATDIEPIFAADARRRQQAAAEMTHQKLGRKTNEDMLVPISEQASAKAVVQAARACKVGKQAVSTAKRVRARAPELFEQVKAGSLTLEEANREVGGRERETKRNEADARRLSVLPDISERARCIHGDMEAVLAEWPAASVDSIITDPPYPSDYLPLFKKLAVVAARVLRPGGTLAVMSGQSYLPEVLIHLTHPELSYRWTLAYLTPGGQAVQLWDRKVNCFWKPVLVYTRRPIDDSDHWIGDVVKSDANDKRHHEWGQSVSGFLGLVKLLSRPGETVMDPFMGAGTTGLAALIQDRQFVGIDIDKAHVETAERRLMEAGRGAA